MNIKPDEIDNIQEIGVLRGRPVKLIRTLGGFYVAIGAPNGSEEALAAGSHPAIVRFNLKKKYSDFHITMAKSEHEPAVQVIENTRFLSNNMVKNGYDLYLIKSLNKSEYVLTKYNNEILKASIFNGSISLKNKSNIDKDIILQTKEAIKKALLDE